jgi:hypothetical protein
VLGSRSATPPRGCGCRYIAACARRWRSAFASSKRQSFFSLDRLCSKRQCCTSTVSLLARALMWEFSLQERHHVRSARVRQHTVFDNLEPLAEHSADILAPPCRQTLAQCGLFRSHLLVICAAKPRYTAAAAREHRRDLAPRLPTCARRMCNVPDANAMRGAR